jgi:hypothetical protein
MARTHTFFFFSPKSQNSQDTQTSDYKGPRGIKMSSRDKGEWAFIGKKKVEGPAGLF